MTSPAERAVAIVGVSAILPDARDADAFWANVRNGRYSISDVEPVRWDPALYFDADHDAPDRTYSKIGGWVRDWDWNPLAWKLPIPPRVGEAIDDAQKWAVACTRMALMDFGWPDRPLDLERTAVVIGNAMAGEKHYLTALRLTFPELARDLDDAPSFAALPASVRAAITGELHARMDADLPPTTEDTMPGELGNCLAGRVANLFNLRGPNFVVDAACASTMAAMDASIEGLIQGQFDAAVTGGVDRNMGVTSFIKFCAIGALSGTGTRPYADGADGFVMGEGAGLFLLKRLADAERDGDRIYAVVRGMAGASDGKGKGLTAPNPIGQKLAIERAWRNAGLSPAECSLMEGHGTSTSVGDYVELSSLSAAFAGAGLSPGSIALGSVKSNIGHLKAAAGAAGMLKATLALHHKTLPPSLGFTQPNPSVDWSSSPFAVNTELRDWEVPDGATRVAGVSAFGFGGTNYHGVLEEYVPGRLSNGNGRATIAVPADVPAADSAKEIPAAGASTPARASAAPAGPAAPAKPPLRGAFLVGAADEDGLAARLRAIVESGDAPPPAPPAAEDLGAAERICIDYGDASELAAKAKQALKAIASGNPAAWKALRGRGIFRGSGAPGEIAFLFTGQGSQYANMLAELRRTEPIVAATFDEADAIMRPLLGGRALSDIIFVGPEGVADAEAQLMRTEITQPAVLTVDVALTRLMAAYGIVPDLVMGHSLGEYGALVVAGVLSFSSALEAVSARGREMANLSVSDNGAMAAVSAPTEEIERIVDEVDGYVVLANVNSTNQVVIGGATAAVEQAIEMILARGHRAQRVPVSHAFHTEIVAGVGTPLRATLRRLRLSPPRIPVVANVDGEFYPSGPGVEERIVEILGRQVASPVQFVKGLHTLYDAGARVFVETGPKWALWGFASDVLGDDVLSLFTNHPKVGDLVSFNQALCGLYASGAGAPDKPATAAAAVAARNGASREPRAPSAEVGAVAQALPGERPARDDEPVVITGAAVGTPGTEKVFDDGNLSRLLHGEQFIDVIPAQARREIAERHITRLVKDTNGTGTFQVIDNPADVIKLAARAGELDLSEYGIDAARVAALGHETQLAIAVGIDALCDAGIPLVQHYKDTTRGTKLPDHWQLPEALQDDTGVIFASAFPGTGDFVADLNAFWTERVKRGRLEELREVRARADAGAARDDVDRRITELEGDLEQHPYAFDRRFLFRVLSMGHSQFAELIGARGPNTQLNAACASTTQAIGMAEDWIRAGRCRRVVVVAADDVTSETLLPWIGAGFLASGAAATDDVVEEAALPFDARRHGLILGMGAAGIVVESAAAARERGMTPICEVLGSVTANSAFHGSRLDVEHIGEVMERVVCQAEARGVARAAMAPETVFVSHETYTPARGGSAAAEIHALRHVFAEQADEIVIANTKGITGHPMGVGLEDIVAIKTLETGLVPAVPNFRDTDPQLGALNLSKGGLYPVRYALRLAAGFGSQVSMMLLRWTPVADGRRRSPEALGYGYRIADEAVWKAWLRGLTGQAEPQLEVVHHRLRVVDIGPTTHGVPRRNEVAAPVTAPAPVAAPVPAATAPTVAAEPAAAPVPAATAPTVAAEPAAAPAPAATAPTVAAEPAAAPAPAAAAPSLATDLRAAPALVAAAAPLAAAPAPVAAAASPAASPAAAPAAAPTNEEITAAVLEIVAAQTGYPADMLDPDLDLEADLGIDTVKQAETFAAIRERYGIERDDALSLRDYPTLRSVVGFVEDRTGITPAIESAAPAAAAPTPPAPAESAPAAEPTVSAPAAEPAPAASTVTAPTTEEITAAVLEIVAAQTGYPADMLDPDLDLEADLGIDTVKQAETFAAIRERYGIERDDALSLRDYPTLRSVVGFVEDRTGITPAIESAAPASAAPTPPAPAAESAAPAAAAPTPPAPAAESAPAESTPAGSARAAEPAPAAPAVTAPTTEEITAAVLEIVAAQTGYPADMLDPDLDLEADLGIDTVKQAETFAAIRERYGIERDDALSLRDYPTLRSVVGFVEDRTGITPAIESAASAAAVPTPPAPAAESAAPAAAAPTPPAPAAESAPAESTPAGSARAAEPAPAAPAVTAPTTEEITAAVLEIVAAQTGYPADMLDPDLDLEADLGIDTVKQAETFAAIRERYGIERDDALSLRDYPTLRSVVGFVEDRTAASPPKPQAQAAPDAAFPRRVPVPVLRPPLERCEPTGLALGPGSRVLVVSDRGGVGAAVESRLRKLGVEIASPEDGGRVDGVYWLPALDAEPALADLDPAAWHAGLDLRVKRLAILMRELPLETFLIAATRLGGRHGYDEAGATSVMGGAVTGFTKALARERAGAVIKAVDFEPSRRTAEPADRLIAEALRDPGAVEVGYADGLRWTVALMEREAVAEPARRLASGATFAITGAAGSIVSAITADLARAAGGGTFHLLDLVPRPDAQDPDAARFATDRDGLKRELADRLRAAGEKPTPVQVERGLARIERARAALAAIAAIEGAGGTAHWHEVDLTDARAVEQALDGVDAVDVLVHGAGLEISHPLPDKPQREYDLVFDVKADGWFNVLHALRGRRLDTAVGFSSIAARFGNAGQTDYSAANDLLCKTISSFRRGGVTRGIAIDWTAWAEIGMASRGSIPKIMAAGGIDMLPSSVGIPVVRREIEGGGGEVVVAGALGAMLALRSQEIDSLGGPMSGPIATMTVDGGLEIRTELDPTRQGFLYDHRIEGTPVLPGVMGMEAFAEAAAALAPGYAVTAVEDVELRSPFKFYRDEPRTVEIRALVRADGDGGLVADCRLAGRRTLANGAEQETVHFTGRVRLAREAPAAPHIDPLPTLPAGAVVSHDAVYRVYFHGPTYQVLEQAYRHNGDIVGLMAANLPPNNEPAAEPTRIVPRLIELCFQTAGVWELGTTGAMGLPTHVDRLLRFAAADAPGRLTAIVHPRADGSALDAEVIDEQGTVRIRLEGYRTTALPAPFDEDVLAPLRAVMNGASR